MSGQARARPGHPDIILFTAQLKIRFSVSDCPNVLLNRQSVFVFPWLPLQLKELPEPAKIFKCKPVFLKLFYIYINIKQAFCCGNAAFIITARVLHSAEMSQAQLKGFSTCIPPWPKLQCLPVF